jgi:hypothetical protein
MVVLEIGGAAVAAAEEEEEEGTKTIQILTTDTMMEVMNMIAVNKIPPITTIKILVG